MAASFFQRKQIFCSAEKKDGRILFFVYNEVLLIKICMKKENSEYFQAKGYPVEKGFNSILAELFKKLSSEKENAIASMNEYKNCTKQCIKFL